MSGCGAALARAAGALCCRRNAEELPGARPGPCHPRRATAWAALGWDGAALGRSGYWDRAALGCFGLLWAALGIGTGLLWAALGCSRYWDRAELGSALGTARALCREGSVALHPRRAGVAAARSALSPPGHSSQGISAHSRMPSKIVKDESETVHGNCIRVSQLNSTCAMESAFSFKRRSAARLMAQHVQWHQGRAESRVQPLLPSQGKSCPFTHCSSQHDLPVCSSTDCSGNFPSLGSHQALAGLQNAA